MNDTIADSSQGTIQKREKKQMVCQKKLNPYTQSVPDRMTDTRRTLAKLRSLSPNEIANLVRARKS